MAKIKSDILSDDLNAMPIKTPSPMEISINDNAKPLKVLAARRVPKRYEEPAELTIQEVSLFKNLMAGYVW